MKARFVILLSVHLLAALSLTACGSGAAAPVSTATQTEIIIPTQPRSTAEPEPTIKSSPTAAPPPVSSSPMSQSFAPSQTIIGHLSGDNVYDNAEGGFSIRLPEGWVVEGPQQMALGSVYWLGPKPLATAEPATSIIIVGDANKVSMQDAVRHSCGGGCAKVSLEATTINGVPAQHLKVGDQNTPLTEWYWLRHGNHIIYLSIHDPHSLQSRDDVIQTLRFN